MDFSSYPRCCISTPRLEDKNPSRWNTSLPRVSRTAHQDQWIELRRCGAFLGVQHSLRLPVRYLVLAYSAKQNCPEPPECHEAVRITWWRTRLEQLMKNASILYWENRLTTIKKFSTLDALDLRYSSPWKSIIPTHKPSQPKRSQFQ